MPEEGSDDDNVKLLGGKPIDPDIMVSFDKVVNKGRGG
jgi:hypothetical protein